MLCSTAHVLYVDHKGHPAPLGRCFHATASRRLSSSVDRHPPSTITQVDSAYCPQCLSFHDVSTAASLGFCPRPTCRRCPICTAVAVAAVLEDNVCAYKCGYCSWTSQECNLTSKVVPTDDGSVGKAELVKATEELGNLLQRRVSKNDSAAESHYQTMLQALDTVARDEVRQRQRQRQRGGSKLKKRDDLEEWSIETLEESILIKKNQAHDDIDTILGGQTLHRLSLNEPVQFDASLNNAPTISLAWQTLSSSAVPSLRSDLLPLPIPLRARKSRRCRAELAEGRPGILVKPKLNPLEGDSSLRSGHGQWWKKDSGAIHVLPRLHVVKHEQKGSVHSFLVRVKNPTLGMVRMRLGPSSYRGQLGWEDTPDAMMKNTLLDSLIHNYADVSLDCSATSTLDPTEMTELEPVEDVLFELGRSQSEEPEAVSSWAPFADETSLLLRWLVSKGDTAWFELQVMNSVKPQSSVERAAWSAVPIALEIQVGDGSWESSLIQPAKVKGPDLVKFDVLVAFR